MQPDVSPRTNHIEFFQTRDTILSSQDLMKPTIVVAKERIVITLLAVLFYAVHTFYDNLYIIKENQ